MHLRSYDGMLPQILRAKPEVLEAILGRQGQFFTKPGVDPSPFMTTSLEAELRAIIDAAPVYDSGISDMRMKARTKWYGAQGQTCDPVAYAAAFDAYYSTATRPITWSPSQFIRQALRVILAPMRELEYADRSSFVRESPNKAFRKKSSNSGYFGFTSDPAARLRLLESVWPLAALEWHDAVMYHPAIAWYRHQRQKYRAIFGDSIVNLAMAKAVARDFFEVAPYHVPLISWVAPTTTYLAFRKYLVGHPDVTVMEGDFKAMDQHFTLAAALFVVKEVCMAADIPLSYYANLEQLLIMYFNQSVVGPLGEVRMGEHTLFSGQFPTNPLECYGNILVQLRFIELVAIALHRDPWDILENSFIRVMGDDSVTVLPRIDIPAADLQLLYVMAGAELHLEVEPSKCRVATDSFWFCKHGYRVDWRSLVKSERGMYIPAYPIDLALLNIRFPEEGIRYNYRNPDDLSTEVMCDLARFDGAVGDPAFDDVVWRWAQEFGPKTILQEVTAAYLTGQRPYQDFLGEICGHPEWNPTTSPSVRLIRSRLSK